MVTKSWLYSLWPISKNQSTNETKPRVEIISFEAASSMAKIMHTWQSLSDKSVVKLRQEVSNSAGIRQLVSDDDDDYVAGLMSAEMTENMAHVAAAVSRLSKKCHDPLLRSFDRAFNDLVRNGGDAYGWRLTRKKMAGKMRKMENFVVSNNKLYQAMEMLADLEQALKRTKDCDDYADGIMIVEYEKKIAAKRQEVSRLKENSLWGRTFDYTVLLLARSLFTVYTRIGHVFGTDARFMYIYHNGRRGYGSLMQSSVYPSENCVPNRSGKFVSMSGPLTGVNDSNDYRTVAWTGPVSKRYAGAEFFSSPLVRWTSKVEPVLKASKSGYRLWQFQSSKSNEKLARQKSSRVTMSGPLTGFLTGAKSVPAELSVNEIKGRGDRLFDDSTSKILNPPPETLGASALALHYANVIIFIEKLVASPRLIDQDARDSLYSMLPSSIRATLRARLKPSTPGRTERTESISEILEWLAPLAHNMIRWHSSRSIEHQSYVSKAKLFLVQTIYFANREKTEKAIVDLLLGLNSLWQFSREIDTRVVD